MVCAIVLAAGRARRMGTQKLLLPLAGQPLIARIVDVVLGTRVNSVFVVTGRDGDAIRQALAGRSVAFVSNPDPESEMLASIRCGLKVLPRECTAALVVLGDQPGIDAVWIEDLIAAHERAPKSIVVPVFNGARGHPLLIDRCFENEILTAHDDVGLRGLLRNHPDAILEVPVSAPGGFEDIDEPGDYRRWLERIGTARR